MAKPSWKTKDDPDLPDLIEAMLHDERKQFYSLGSVSEREEFLAKIETRWRQYRESAKNRPASDESSDPLHEVKSGLLELHRRLQTGELVDTTLTPPSSRSSHKKLYRILRQALFGAVALLSALILERLSAPTWLIIITLAIALLCVAILPKVERASKSKRRMFWCALILYSGFALSVTIGKSEKPKSAQPTSVGADTTKPAETRSFADVDASYFAQVYRTHSSAQADIAIHGFIGKWIKTTGEVSDVRRDQSLGAESAYVTIKIPTKDVLQMYIVFGQSNQPSFMERALTLNRGEQVSIVGKIRKADDMGLVLDECEIVP